MEANENGRTCGQSALAGATNLIESELHLTLVHDYYTDSNSISPTIYPNSTLAIGNGDNVTVGDPIDGQQPLWPVVNGIPGSSPHVAVPAIDIPDTGLLSDALMKMILEALGGKLKQKEPEPEVETFPMNAKRKIRVVQ